MKQPAWLTALMLMALALGLFCLCGAAPGAASAPALVATEIDHQLLARARRMHERVLVLDTHVDIAGPQYATDQLDPGVDNPRLRCDLVKMAAGGVDGVFLAVYVGQGRRDAAGYRQALDRATGKFRAIHRLAERYPDRCALATSPDDVCRIVASGKRAIMIGVENGYPMGEDLGLVDRFYQRGARYVTLCHNGHNQLCDSCSPRPDLGDGPREHGGLSPLGRKAVQRMNRLGMMVDVSHLAESSFWDVLECSQAPVIASHSGCRALCDHPRNLSDRQLKALAARGGVIHVVAVGAFLRSGLGKRRQAIRQLAERLGIPWGHGEAHLDEASAEQKAAFSAALAEIDRRYPLPSLRDFVDHVDHAVRIAGIEHVGIGSDLDGGGGVIGFEHHGQAHRVTAELLRRGYTEDQIALIWGGNLLRLWQQVEAAAEARKLPAGTP